MKKILIGLVIVAFIAGAGAAQAATVYKDDTVKYNIMMDWQMQFVSNEFGDESDIGIVVDDLEIRNYLEYNLDNGWAAFGRVDFAVDKAADDGSAGGDGKVAQFEEAWMGVKKGNYELSFGNSPTRALYWGINESYEDPGDLDTTAFGEKFADDLIQFKAKKLGGIVDLTISHELEAADTGSEGNADTIIEAAMKFKMGLMVDAIYQTVEDDNGQTVMGIAVGYDFKVVEVLADYSVNSNDTDDGVTVMNGVVIIPVKKYVSVAAGLMSLDYEDDAVDDVTAWYANLSYGLAKGVKVFGEISQSDADDKEMTMLAGLSLKF